MNETIRNKSMMKDGYKKQRSLMLLTGFVLVLSALSIHLFYLQQSSDVERRQLMVSTSFVPNVFTNFFGIRRKSISNFVLKPSSILLHYVDDESSNRDLNIAATSESIGIRGANNIEQALLPPAKRRISLVVPLWKAGKDLGKQLSYLANGYKHKLQLETEHPELRIELIANMKPSDGQDLKVLFPDLPFLWKGSTDLSLSEYLRTSSRQESWLQQRYPNDDNASYTETTLNVDISWKQTSNHLRMLLLQQQTVQGPLQESPFSRISLPFLVSSESLDMNDKQIDFSFLNGFFPISRDTICHQINKPEISQDEVILVAQDLNPTLHLDSSSFIGVLVVIDPINNAQHEDKRDFNLLIGHNVRSVQTKSQIETFCWAAYSTGNSQLSQWARIFSNYMKEEEENINNNDQQRQQQQQHSQLRVTTN